MFFKQFIQVFNQNKVPVRFKRSFRGLKERMEEDGLIPFSEDDQAFNRLAGLLKPIHTVEEQIEYMAKYWNVYKDRPIWETSWRRNLRTQLKWQPPTRLFCIDRNGRFNVNNACPICRDEYFFFDYRNPKLILHFLQPGTDLPITNLKTGLCIEQTINLQAQVLKAKENEWYPGLWEKEETLQGDEELPKRNVSVDDIYQNPDIEFPIHNRDFNNHCQALKQKHHHKILQILEFLLLDQHL
ncbi:hypothetical protein Mgra_00006098 [Meloidogyne graminicola]|uniref:28S ribosomal protein S18b, mitochondrial n=1 Tax=Meloidogyne graminicola TaxID=189291 RepID=A0A8S9ZN71_9BILA|nr:hypothetical protein Mgra_00006098 [Meloidogyne graminicola]